VSLKSVVAAIKRNKRFLITAHVNLEGDALGSELAFLGLLKALGKEAVIVNEDPVPYGYDFLPGADKIIQYRENMENPGFDCFVALDCSNLKRCGEVYRLNNRGNPVINIDHHVSNDFFADINWVEPHLSSACEMVYLLYSNIGVPLNKAVALCLYAGLLTDTGSFRYSNTTSSVHMIAARLLEYGIDASDVYRRIYSSIPAQDIKLLAQILPKMKFSCGGKVVWFSVPGRILRKTKPVFDLSENILNFGRSVGGTEVVILFKENLGSKKEVRVNFRSDGKINVNIIAKIFGGGGHRTASACTVSGTLKSVCAAVLEKTEGLICRRLKAA